jgi:hypothetical protein
MKPVLTTIVIALSWGCSTYVKPAPRAPSAPVSAAPGLLRCPDGSTDCTQTNGTRATGLAQGDRADTIRAITLTSGEIITLR